MTVEKKKDVLNVYFTNCLNSMLKKIGLEEIQPNELKDICLSSSYQGTNKPETVLIVTCKNKMLSFRFEKGKLTSSNWRYF